MKDMQKVLLGGLAVLLGIFGLSKLAKGAASLYLSYVNELMAVTTRPELDAIRYRFEYDYTVGLLTRTEYDLLYNLYVTRIP